MTSKIGTQVNNGGPDCRPRKTGRDESSRVVSRNSIISGDISERKYPRGKHKDRIRNERKVIQLW